jgi:AmmeMemoRadiSam system protein B
MQMRFWICLLGTLFVAQHSWAREHHYSSWSDNPQPYLQAIQRSSSLAPAASASRNIRAGIVTHHFLASGLMVRFFELLRAKVSPETIILIGPNHFHHGRGNISLSSLPWKTPFGVLETDRPTIQQIEVATKLPEDPEAFTGEHSVGVLIPFLKYYFPHSRVVPILIDVNADESQLRVLRTLLVGSLENPRVLAVLSMDFSHNSTAGIADSRDEEAKRVISTLDVRQVNGLHVDCHKGLSLVLSALRDLGHVKAHFVEHANSSRLSRNPKQTNVTSYFTVSFGL